jgi:hypothetical protein
MPITVVILQQSLQYAAKSCPQEAQKLGTQVSNIFL